MQKNRLNIHLRGSYKETQTLSIGAINTVRPIKMKMNVPVIRCSLLGT